MRITSWLLLIGCMHLSAASLSQTVTLSVDKAPLEEVLESIQEQTGYFALSSREKLQMAKSVTLHVRKLPLQETLELLFKDQPLSFQLDGKTILISVKDGPEQQGQYVKRTNSDNQPPPPQQLSLNGKLIDSMGEPVVGAVVRLMPANLGTTTDKKGNFIFPKVAAGPYVIVFSSIGYQRLTKNIRIDEGSNLMLGELVMKHDITKLEDAVVTNGLFNRPKSSFTGSVSSFSGAELKRVGNQNLLQSLAILEPSFRIIENTDFGSDPNRVPEVMLRGASGIPDLNAEYQNAPNLPLFILDGFETTVQKVYDLNMNLIASVTLLKDASAKAIYGSKAGNGVVVIETVRPKAGKLRLSYAGSMDLNAPDLSSYHLTNSLQKVQAELLSGKYSSPYPENQFDLTTRYNANLKEALRGVDTYWLSQPLQNGIGQKHNVAIDGGSEGMRYYAGINYNKVSGVMKGSDRNTISGTVNLEYRKDHISFQNNLNIDHNKAVNSPYGDFADYSRLNPYWRIYDDNGQLIKTYLDGQVANPLYDASLNTKNSSGYTTITENFYGEWQALKSLKLTARGGLSLQDNNTEFFLPASHSRYANIFEGSPEYLTRGEYTITNGKQNMVSGDFGAAYSRIFGKNQVYSNLLYSIQQSTDRSNGMTMVGFPNDKMDDISMGSQYLAGSKASGAENTSRNMGVTAAVNYSYDNRYLADFSYRANASSQFGANKRWGSFWSAGLGWNLQNEAIIRKLTFINQLRLRGSVGSTGSQNFSSYQSIATYGYVTDQVYNGELGLQLLALDNPDLKWQQVLDKNIGMDINLFNRLSLRFDYYISDTKDLLSDQSTAPSTGFASYKENVGETRNQGYQANVSVRLLSIPQQRTFISLFANVAHNSNKIRKVSEALKTLNEQQDQIIVGDGGNAPATSKPLTRFAEGQSLSAIWAVPSRGIDPVNGKEIFVKRDGTLSYTWSADDQVVVGDALAKYNGSFGANLQHRGISLNFAFSYQLGGQLYNNTLVDKIENADINYNVDVRVLEGRWTTPGQYSFFKDIADRTVTKPSSRFVQDNNELIFSSVSLGYDLSRMPFVKSMKMSSLSMSANLNELGRIGSVKTERGLSYPYARTMSFSLQATF